jgi:hypothetical protein
MTLARLGVVSAATLIRADNLTTSLPATPSSKKDYENVYSFLCTRGSQPVS